MFAQYIVKVLILLENKIVAATCKCSALRLKKVILALSDFRIKLIKLLAPEPKDSTLWYRNWSLDMNLRHFYPSIFFIAYFFNLRRIVLPSPPQPCKWSLAKWFFHQNYIHMSSLCQIFISSLCTSHDCTVPAVLGGFCTVFLKCPLVQLTQLQTTFRALCLHTDQPLVLHCSWVPGRVGVSQK